MYFYIYTNNRNVSLYGCVRDIAVYTLFSNTVLDDGQAPEPLRPCQSIQNVYVNWNKKKNLKELN